MGTEQSSREQGPLTVAEIEALRALEAKATPGPWAFGSCGDENRCGVGVVVDENDEPIVGLDETEDGIVVESVAPEVEGYANAALIAAMRNALPRLLSMLQPPTDAEVREAVEWLDGVMHEYGGLDWVEVPAFRIRTLLSYIRATRAEAELAALKSGPTDAAVPEAVEAEWLAAFTELCCCQASARSRNAAARVHAAHHALLSHVRAVQSPRLAGERLEALNTAYLHVRHHGPQHDANAMLAVFPELQEMHERVFGKE